MRNVKYIQYSVLVITLYLFINNPLLQITRGIGSAKLLWPIMFSFFLFSKKKHLTNLYNKCQKEIACLFVVLIYTILRSCLADSFLAVRSIIVGIVNVIFVPYFIVTVVKDKITLINSILVVGAVGAIISCLCIAFPSFNLFVKNSVISLPSDSFLLISDFRGFGIAERLTSDYGVVQGIILALGVYQISKSKWFIPFMPFVFMSAIFNARTGAFISIACIAIVLLSQHNNKASLLFLTILVLLLPYYQELLEFVGVSDSTLEWSSGLFSEMESIRNTHDFEGTILETLFGRMFILPESLGQWIFGRGYSFFGMANVLGRSSDVGYVNQLAFGGLLYIIPLYSFIFICFNKMRNNGSHVIAVIFIITFLVANLKGSYLLDSGGLRLLMIIYFTIIFPNSSAS